MKKILTYNRITQKTMIEKLQNFRPTQDSKLVFFFGSAKFGEY